MLKEAGGSTQIKITDFGFSKDFLSAGAATHTRAHARTHAGIRMQKRVWLCTDAPTCCRIGQQCLAICCPSRGSV